LALLLTLATLIFDNDKVLKQISKPDETQFYGSHFDPQRKWTDLFNIMSRVHT